MDRDLRMNEQLYKRIWKDTYWTYVPCPGYTILVDDDVETNNCEKAIKQVRDFIEACYSSRFTSIGRINQDLARDRILNQAGYIRKHKDRGYEYLVFPETFDKEACKGLNPKYVRAILAEQGLLIRSKEGYHTNPVNILGQGLKRMIVLSSSITINQPNIPIIKGE